MDDLTPKCENCGCDGNVSCLYPPTSEEIAGGLMDCSLDDKGDCYCCQRNIDRMSYRPEEDGQLDLPVGT